MIREQAVKKELPSGYQWRLRNQADDEGIIFCVSLVQSSFKEGTWRDRFFSREIMHSNFETELEAPNELIEARLEETKTHIASIFFRQ